MTVREHVARPQPWSREHVVRLEGDRLAWRVGRRGGTIELADIAEVRVRLGPPGAAQSSVCLIRTSTGRQLRVSDLHRSVRGGSQRRTESFDAFVHDITTRLAESFPETRLLSGSSRIEWLATLVVLAALGAVLLVGAGLMINEGRIVWPALAFMALAISVAPLLWPVVRSGGPKPMRARPAASLMHADSPSMEIPMPNLILTYTLKPGLTRERFETWVRDTDYPAMRGLARVRAFTTHRAEKLLVGEGAPPCDYVELFAIEDMDGFIAQDMPGETVQRIMGEFFTHVDNPAFIIVSEVT